MIIHHYSCCLLLSNAYDPPPFHAHTPEARASAWIAHNRLRELLAGMRNLSLRHTCVCEAARCPAECSGGLSLPQCRGTSTSHVHVHLRSTPRHELRSFLKLVLTPAFSRRWRRLPFYLEVERGEELCPRSVTSMGSSGSSTESAPSFVNCTCRAHMIGSPPPRTQWKGARILLSTRPDEQVLSSPAPMTIPASFDAQGKPSPYRIHHMTPPQTNEIRLWPFTSPTLPSRLPHLCTFNSNVCLFTLWPKVAGRQSFLLFFLRVTTWRRDDEWGRHMAPDEPDKRKSVRANWNGIDLKLKPWSISMDIITRYWSVNWQSS